MATATQTLVLGLSDRSGHDLGIVEVESIHDGSIRGDFIPGPDYSVVEPAFRTFSEMVEGFSLSLIDQVMGEISSFGITVRADPSGPPVPVHDVQIFSDGGFSCRLPPRQGGRDGGTSIN